MVIKIYVDGGTYKNRICVYDMNKSKSNIKHMHRMTNNMLEYKAIQKAIDYIKENYTDGEKVQVFSDSQLIVNQINGQYKIYNNDLFYECWKVKKSMPINTQILWVPRERNIAGKILERR